MQQLYNVHLSLVSILKILLSGLSNNLYWPYLLIVGSTLLVTQCLNFLADSNLLDNDKDYNPDSLMNMVWCVRLVFLWALERPVDLTGPLSFVLRVYMFSYGLISIYISKYFSHLFTLKSDILFIINVSCYFNLKSIIITIITYPFIKSYYTIHKWLTFKYFSYCSLNP